MSFLTMSWILQSSTVLPPNLSCSNKISIDRLCDCRPYGWMKALRFFFLTVAQSYQDDERVIMKALRR